MGDLFLKYAILLCLVICLHVEAHSSGLTQHGAEQIYPNVELSAPFISQKSRILKQTGEFAECSLSEDEVGSLLDNDDRVWSLDNAALSDFGLQTIIDCTEEGDTLIFDLDDVFKPTERIVIPWNLTLSSSIQETGLFGGIFPSASKTRLTCPDEDIGIFLVEATDVLFANLAFEDCVLTEDSSDAAIVEVASCDSEDKSGTIRLHNVDFANNQLTDAYGLDVGAGCSSVEMVNVTFEENDCSGICGVSLSIGSNVLRNVTILDNRETRETVETSAVIYCPPDSEVAAENVVARGNAGATFYVDRASLQVKDSIFEENFVGANSTVASGIHLRDSEAKIENCEFVGNSGELGSSSLIAINCSSIEITECSFARNNASELRGAAVYSNRTESLKVKRTTFVENTATDGGAVYLEDTGSEFEDCVFEENNAAGNAGGLFLQNGTSTVANCAFEDNAAAELGGGLHCVSGTLNVSDSQFRGNEASGGAGTALASGCVAELENIVWEDNLGGGDYGGGLLVLLSTAAVKNSVATANSGQWGGGIFFDDGNGTCSNVTLTKNEGVEFGGGLATRSSTVDISDCLFEDNECQDGGAMYFGVSSAVSVANCSFAFNSATRYGGGVAVTGSSFGIISESTFRNNSISGSFGGCFYINEAFLTLSKVSVANSTSGEFSGALDASSSVTSITDSVFEDNTASSDGGAIRIVSGFFSAANISVIRSISGRNGGGIYIAGAVSTITNSSFSSNMAETNGGGLLITNSTATLNNLIVTQNRGKWGGGIFFDNGNGTCSNITLDKNKGVEFGGGLGTRESTIVVSGCLFEDNECQDGAAIYLGVSSSASISNCSVAKNGATRYAGGVALTGSSIASITASVFDSNSAVNGSGGTLYSSSGLLTLNGVSVTNSTCKDYGGALYTILSSIVSISNSKFENCSAEVDGGGFNVVSGYLTMTNSSIVGSRTGRNGGGMWLIDAAADIKDCNITGNYAGSGGGGIYSSNCTFTADRMMFVRNEAGSSGGCFDVPEYGSFVFTNSVFNHCRAEFGAAIDVFKDVNGTLVSCSGYNNSAITSGGVAYVQQSNLTIIDGEFVQNKATYGGGVQLSNSWLLMNNSVFSSGYASEWGGAINARDGSYIIAQDVLLEDNQADYGGSLCTKETYIWAKSLQIFGCKAKDDGGGLYAYDRSSFLCTGCYFKNNFAAGNGGGVFLDSKTPQLLAYQFDNTTFELNKAKLGGGINFVSEVGLKNCSDPEEGCTFVALRGSTFRDNDASTAGGGIMSRDLDSVRLSCSYDLPEDPLAFLTREEYFKLLSISSLDMLCDGWKTNTAKSYGKDVGSFARGIKKYIRLDSTAPLVPVEPDFYIIRDHRSGSPLPDLYFESVDQLGQGPAISPSLGELTARMTSPDKLFDGSNEIQFTKGGCNFTGTIIYKEAGLYRAVVDFNDSSIPQFSMIVRIRDCMIGEAPTANRALCQPCNGDTYNFHPQREDPGCVPCPDHGNCSTHVIMPNRGYWHLSPCSTHVQECLSERACEHGHRFDDLKEVSKGVDSCNFTSNFVADYMDAQCAEGYQGPLCGSCEPSYGRSRAFRCEKCFSGFGNFVLVALTLMVLLLLSTFAIRSSLPTHRRGRKKKNRRNERASVESLPPEGHEDSGAYMADLAIHGRSLYRDRTNDAERQTKQDCTTSAASECEIAKWKAVEIFKITINYLQVIAIAVSVNVTWNDALIAAFETAEFIGGVTSEAATRSVDCMVSDDSTVSRSAVRTVVSILVPLVVTGFWAVFWAAAMYRYQESMHYLSKRSILSICAVSYLSYIAITKTAVNVLYCVDVYDSPDFESDSTTAYWAVDTQLKCYKGSHAILTGLFGWPVIIFYSLGFPIIVAVLLIAARNKEGTQTEWLYESTGFLYRAYSSTYVYWESVIMLRKAVLAVVVVFAYPLGGNLQGVLCVSVLTVALYFQTVCCPFREEFDQLNRFEALSLLVSSLTFVSGLFYNDDHTSNAARILLTICLFCANLGLLAFFGFTFYRSGGDYIRTVLDDEGIVYDPTGGAYSVIKTYLLSRFGEYFDRWFRSKAPPTATV